MLGNLFQPHTARGGLRNSTSRLVWALTRSGGGRPSWVSLPSHSRSLRSLHEWRACFTFGLADLALALARFRIVIPGLPATGRARDANTAVLRNVRLSGIGRRQGSRGEACQKGQRTKESAGQMNRIVSIWAISALMALSASEALASPPVTTLVSFDPSLGELPESLTSDDFGNLYISAGGTIRKFDAAHRLSTLATLPIPLGAFSVGLKVGPDGYIYVASGALFTEPNAAFIWRVSPRGVAKVFATLPPTSFPNDLAFDEDGQLYVTDSFQGQIWKIDSRGNPSVWLQDERLLGNPAAPVPVFHAFGANGIALDASGHHLYVGNTDYGRILRVGIHAGKPGEIEVIAESDLLKGADGVALDERGTLYVAVNALDRIATIDRRGKISVYAEGGPLDAPSSLVFGTQCRGERTLYLSSFALYRANGFIPGAPHPAIQSIPVPFAGLDLDAR